MVKSQPIDLNLGHRSSQALLNVSTKYITTKYGYKDRTSTYKGKGVEKLVVYPRIHNKMPRTQANSPRAEKTATTTEPSYKMNRAAWENHMKSCGLVENTVAFSQRNDNTKCHTCFGTGHLSHKCPWVPFFDKNGKCKNPWGTTTAEQQRTKRKRETVPERDNPYDEDTWDLSDKDRQRVKRQRGLLQRKNQNLLKRASTYVKVEQDTTKVFCEDDYYGANDEEYNSRTGKKLLWKVCSQNTKSDGTDVINIRAGFNANGKGPAKPIDGINNDWGPVPEGVDNVEEECDGPIVWARDLEWGPNHVDRDEGTDEWERDEAMYGDLDKIPVPEPAPKTNMIDHDPNDEIKVGQSWEWMDDDETTSWACKMVKIDTVGWGPFKEPVVLSKPSTDKRPDQFRGADMVHKEPTYSMIRYTRTPALFGLPVWFSKTIDLVVSEEVATQVLTASNVNYSLSHDAIFNRITQAAKTVSKVNEDRYMVLNKYFPRNDTIIFANNIAKCYFWDRRELKSGVDFTKCQDTTKPKL